MTDGIPVIGGVTVQVTDQYGGYISSTRDIVTGLIYVEIISGRTGEKTVSFLDPNDKEIMVWLKEVYQPIHLELLLGK